MTDTTVMSLCSNALRGAIIAPPGKKLVCSDLEQIEARVLPWLAGEQWKLDAFEAYDRGEGFDNYVMGYARAFNVSPESVTKDQRQASKALELSMGYQGGAGAFLTFAAIYGLNLDALADSAWDSLGAGIRKKAADALDWRKAKKLPTFDLSDRTFIVCESLKLLWRAAHPEIVRFWKVLEDKAQAAIQNPGRDCPAGEHLVFRKDSAWLRMILPSGRSICYPSAQIRDDKLSYMGVDQYTRKWQRVPTFGGKQSENATSGVARDVMTYNMPAAEAAGYLITLTVHDEIQTEAPDTEAFTSEHLSAILASGPPWATGLPLAADGFEAMRYRKN